MLLRLKRFIEPPFRIVRGGHPGVSFECLKPTTIKSFTNNRHES